MERLRHAIVTFLMLITGEHSCEGATWTFSRAEIMKELEGNYELDMENETVKFHLDSSGSMSLHPESDAAIRIQSSFLPSMAGARERLPMLHLHFSVGSDEQVLDYQVILTATKGYNQDRLVMKVIAVIESYSDPAEAEAIARVKNDGLRRIP